MTIPGHNPLTPGERRDLPREALLAFLTELEQKTPVEESGTAYLTHSELRSLDSLSQVWRQRISAVEDSAPSTVKSEVGVVLFWSPGPLYAVVPPFPVERSHLLEGWNPEPLRNLLQQPRRYAAVMVRLGRYAVGVYEGDRLIASKTEQRYVKGKHRAGGQSQRRFERIREGQAHALFDKACAKVQERLTPYEGWLEYVFLGGETHTLQAFLKQCQYLQRLGTPIVERILNVREPNQRALERLSREVWKGWVVRVR